MKKLKVFIVEDSSFFKNWIRDQVKAVQGTEITGLTDTVDLAEEGILSNQPDLLILDLRLKNGNGVDLLKRLQGKKGDMKIIIFTNYPWQIFQDQCRELGADYFYDKSNTFGQLKETIATLVKREKYS